MNQIPALAALPVVTSLYALFLDRTRSFWKPGLTWLTVVGGVLICLGYARATTSPSASAAEYERNLATSFVLGGTPVILWRLLRSKRFGFGTQE